MPKISFAFLAAASAAALAGCAMQRPAGPMADAQPAGRQCFFAGNVNGFGNATDTSVDVQAGAGHYYRLDLTGPCNDISWSTGLVLRTLGGSSWICQGADAEVIVPGRLGGRCLVTGVHPITKAEWLARRP